MLVIQPLMWDTAEQALAHTPVTSQLGRSGAGLDVHGLSNEPGESPMASTTNSVRPLSVKAPRSGHRRRHVLAISWVGQGLLILALLLATTGTAFADGPWSGYWITTWRDGGAHLLLDQQGERVSGTYPLYGGRVEATAKGSRLEGRWFEGDKSGGFVFVLNRAGNSFSGRYDTGEWWTGARSAAPEVRPSFDRSSPREVFRHFVVDCNRARSGSPDSWGDALLSIDFADAGEAFTRSEQLQRLRDLFGLIDLTTFRVWSIPDAAPGQTLKIRLKQSGTNASLPLTMVRDGTSDWRIRMPGEEELDADRHALLARHGGAPASADAYVRLQSPRDTMRSFLEGMADWDGGGRAQALSTLDLSAIPEILRDAQGGLVAQYLRRVLDQVGLVGLQAIPDDGANRTPYLHFTHTAGQIVIAPLGTDAVAPWKFTAQTVADIDDLYRATEGLPPPLATPPGAIPNEPFFILRDFVRATAPGLLGRLGVVEYWQIIGFVIMIAGSLLVGILIAWPIRRLAASLSADGVRQPRSFTWLLAVTFALIVASRFPTVLGIPEQIRHIAFPIVGMGLILAASVAVWHLLGAIGLALQRLSARTATSTDDILFNLLLAGARLGVVIAAVLGIAHFLSVPTNGILAGLGVGGFAFAFASRETLSNVFGAGILVTDRPFRRGDWITAGDIEGSVEHVGIRSTRVRSAQDSIVVVPNGRLADSTINNLGTRRHRLFTTQFLVTAGATPERLEHFTAAVRERVTDDASFLARRTDVGVSGIGGSGIQVELTTYLDVPTSSREREAKHALLVDVISLAETCGLTLGSGTSGPR
jgi:MscS family membrane protein